MKETLYKTAEELNKEALTLIINTAWYSIQPTKERKHLVSESAQTIEMFAIAILEMLKGNDAVQRED